MKIILKSIILILLLSVSAKAQVKSKNLNLGLHPLNNSYAGIEWVKAAKKPQLSRTISLSFGVGTSILSSEIGYGLGASFGKIFGKTDGYKGIHTGASITIANNALGVGPFLGYKNLAVKGHRFGYQFGLTLQFASIEDDDYFNSTLVPFTYFGLSYNI